jgi:putative membrane protein
VCEDAAVSADGQSHEELPQGSRRTQLANERTFLAWMRTGLASVAVGLAIAKLLPTLHEGASWPYVALGVAFCLLGLALVWFGVWRLRVVDRAMSRGEYAPMTNSVALAMGIATGTLSILTMLVVLFNR